MSGPRPLGQPKESMILHLAFALELEAAKERAQWRSPIFKTKWGATKFPPLKGAEAAKSARTADQCNISRRQKFPHTGKQEHASLIRAINMWHKFDVFMPTREGAPSRTAAHSRLAPTWKTVDRRKHAKSRLVAKGYEDPDFGGGSGGNLWLREFAIFESTRRVGALDCGYRKCLFAGGYLSARRVTSRAPRMMLLSPFMNPPTSICHARKIPSSWWALSFRPLSLAAVYIAFVKRRVERRSSSPLRPMTSLGAVSRASLYSFGAFWDVV